MSGEKLSAAIRSFIVRHLSSIEQLDILCLIFAKPEMGWTVETVYRAVLTTVLSVEQSLAKFAASGLIEKTNTGPGTYRARMAGEARDLVPELCRLYRERPSRVIEAIYQKDHAAIQNFADAFKLKRQP